MKFSKEVNRRASKRKRRAHKIIDNLEDVFGLREEVLRLFVTKEFGEGVQVLSHQQIAELAGIRKRDGSGYSRHTARKVMRSLVQDGYVVKVGEKKLSYSGGKSVVIWQVNPYTDLGEAVEKAAVVYRDEMEKDEEDLVTPKLEALSQEPDPMPVEEMNGTVVELPQPSTALMDRLKARQGTRSTRGVPEEYREGY